MCLGKWTVTTMESISQGSLRATHMRAATVTQGGSVLGQASPSMRVRAFDVAAPGKRRWWPFPMD